MQVNESRHVATWLADVLMERSPAWPFAPGEGVDAVLRVAEREGVAALLHARLAASAIAVPDALHAALDAVVRIKAAQSLYRQAQCRAILARLDEAGIPALVLKGLALAHRVHAEPHWRESGDIDLLLPSRDEVQRAVALIAPLGFVPAFNASAGDMVDFEKTCVHELGAGRLEVDVHWHLSNTPLFAFRFGWDELWTDSIPLPTLAPTARGLAPVPALLHACMHRVQNLALGVPDRLKWLYDFAVLARGFSLDEWRDAQVQAIARGLAGVCSHSLGAAESRFGTFVPAGVHAALAAAAQREPMRIDRLQSWWYFQRMSWRAFPTLRMRGRWLQQRLLPNRAYLRERHGSHGGMAGELWRRVWAGARRMRE